MSLHLSSNKAYVDMQGNRRNFDIVDYDVKTSIGTSKLTEEELAKLQKDIKNHLVIKVRALLSLPAIYIRDHNPLLTRVENGRIEWDASAAAEALLINPDLLHSTFNFLWKNLIPEMYWNVDLSYQEIIEGKWKNYVTK